MMLVGVSVVVRVYRLVLHAATRHLSLHLARLIRVGRAARAHLGRSQLVMVM
ncbi:hypothetical protein SFPGR_17110 [Sulfuriferula plumbiphila]|nr:hypothetical protein SFPGR_17110 [Sulfuriferula plumbiphila]